jgi:hypothetical protein
MSPVQYKPHIEESSKTLADIQEYRSDRVVLQLCQVQNIAMQISNMYIETEDALGSSVPIKMYMKILETELERFKRNLSPDLKDNGTYQI